MALGSLANLPANDTVPSERTWNLAAEYSHSARDVAYALGCGALAAVVFGDGCAPFCCCGSGCGDVAVSHRMIDETWRRLRAR